MKVVFILQLTKSCVSLTCYYCKLCDSFGVFVSCINVHKNLPYQSAGPVVHVGYSINVCGDIHSEVHFLTISIFISQPPQPQPAHQVTS